MKKQQKESFSLESFVLKLAFIPRIFNCSLGVKTEASLVDYASIYPNLFCWEISFDISMADISKLKPVLDSGELRPQNLEIVLKEKKINKN